MDDHTQLMGGLLSAVTALDELPHPRPAGHLLLASMPVAVARDVMPTMLLRCQHVPPLLVAKTNRHLLGTTYSGIRDHSRWATPLDPHAGQLIGD